MNKLAFLFLAIGCLLLTSPAMAKRVKDTTPKQDGFRMPGEFEKQKQVWMVWPERTDTYRDGAKPGRVTPVPPSSLTTKETCVPATGSSMPGADWWTASTSPGTMTIR